MIKILAVVGATASGKSSLALDLAEKLGGEIISCDSMQIYKGMDIGTAKPSADEMRRVPHHMIDVCSPEDNFACADYASSAKKIIEQIHQCGKLPIFCGGTGLYLDSVLKISAFPENTGRDDNFRNDAAGFARENGNDALHDRLKIVDPDSASAIHPNNVRRVIRALEIYHCTGITKTEWDRRSKITDPLYDSAVIGLFYKNRDILYERINRRVDMMINDGLENEVRTLFLEGRLPESGGGSQAIGYREMIPYIKGEISLPEAIEKIKTDTRHYAKRQITWFSAHDDVIPVFCDDGIDTDSVLRTLTPFLEK